MDELYGGEIEEEEPYPQVTPSLWQCDILQEMEVETSCGVQLETSSKVQQETSIEEHVNTEVICSDTVVCNEVVVNGEDLSDSDDAGEEVDDLEEDLKDAEIEDEEMEDGEGLEVNSDSGDDEINVQNSMEEEQVYDEPVGIPRVKKEVGNISHLSYEMQQAYRILQELLSDANRNCNWPFLDAGDTETKGLKDYDEVISRPLGFKQVKQGVIDNEYGSITKVIADIRLVLENCYRYFGPHHSRTKKGLKIEQMLEQKLALLPRDLRSMCSIEATSGTPQEDLEQTKKGRVGHFFSHVLHRVRQERLLRDKEWKRKQQENRKLVKEEKEKEVQRWEEELIKQNDGKDMRHMWELPQIGHFVFLSLRALNIFEVPQFELERALFMPQASKTLSMLMTSLLSSPNIRAKLGRLPMMPYCIWSNKLAARVTSWYRLYHRENQNAVKVFELMGIEPDTWKVLGNTNPFETNRFHELTFPQRVWALKSVCDYLQHKHKTIQDCIAEQSRDEQKEYYLGEDRAGWTYMHFPQFCGMSFRLYKQVGPPPPPVEPKPKKKPVTRKRYYSTSSESSTSSMDEKRTRSSEKSKRINNGKDKSSDEEFDEFDVQLLQDDVSEGRMTRAKKKQICKAIILSRKTTSKVTQKVGKKKVMKKIEPKRKAKPIIPPQTPSIDSDYDSDSVVMVNVERQPVQQKIKEKVKVKEKIKEKVKESEDEEEDNQSTVSVKEEIDEKMKTEDFESNSMMESKNGIDSNINKVLTHDFELVAESVEGIRQVVMELAVQTQNGHPVPNCEIQLGDNLDHLLKELEPWENKLIQATRKLRMKLYKEWKDYQTRDLSKSDPAEDVWRREAEGEGDVLEEVKQETKEEKAETLIGDDGFSRHQHARRAKANRQVVIDWEEQGSDDSSDCFQPSSWSKRRLRHLMNKDKTEQTKNKEVPPKPSTRSTRNSNKDQLGGLIMEHQSLNNSHSASQTLEWETHRQELMKSPVKDGPGSILRDTLANATKDHPSRGKTLPTIVASSSSVTTLNSKTTQNGGRSSVLNGGNINISLAGGKVVLKQTPTGQVVIVPGKDSTGRQLLVKLEGVQAQAFLDTMTKAGINTKLKTTSASQTLVNGIPSKPPSAIAAAFASVGMRPSQPQSNIASISIPPQQQVSPIQTSVIVSNPVVRPHSTVMSSPVTQTRVITSRPALQTHLSNPPIKPRILVSRPVAQPSVITSSPDVSSAVQQRFVVSNSVVSNRPQLSGITNNSGQYVLIQQGDQKHAALLMQDGTLRRIVGTIPGNIAAKTTVVSNNLQV